MLRVIRLPLRARCFARQAKRHTIRQCCCAAVSRNRRKYQLAGSLDGLVIIGAGGHGRVVIDLIRKQGKIKVVGFLDDDPGLHGRTVCGLPILGGSDKMPELVRQGIRYFVAAIGDNRARARRFEEALAAGLVPWDAIHPSAIIAEDVEYGQGLQVLAGAIVNPGARIGRNVILNTGCIIEHDCHIGSHVFVAPGVRLGGSVQVGEGCLLGIGAIVLPGRRIGPWAVVGAGAVVTRDVPEGQVVAGVPARAIGEQKTERP